MNIILSNYDDLRNPYYGGGGALAVHELASRLAKKHVVTVLTGKYPNSKNAVIDGVQYKRIGFSFGQPQLDQLLYQLSLPWYVITNHFDIWFESFTPPFSTAFLPWFTKEPVVGVTHLLAGSEMSKKYHLPFARFETFGLKQYKHIVVLSEFLKEQALHANPTARISIIPNGLPIELLTKEVQKQEKHILFLGRIDIFHKGLDILFEGFAKAKEKIELPLVIAGFGPKQDEERIRKYTNEFGIGSRVVFKGKVEGQEKYELLEDAAIVIIPSRIEGFAIVALEAMAFKCPLIVSDIPGLRWIPSDCAIRVPVENSEALAKSIVELLANSEKRKRMGEHGKEFVKDFTWDKVAEKYEQLIQQLSH